MAGHGETHGVPPDFLRSKWRRRELLWGRAGPGMATRKWKGPWCHIQNIQTWSDNHDTLNQSWWTDMKRQSQNLFEFEKMVREGIASRDCKSNVGMEASAKWEVTMKNMGREPTKHRDFDQKSLAFNECQKVDFCSKNWDFSATMLNRILPQTWRTCT